MTIATAASTARQGPPSTVSSPRLRALQLRHAIALNVVPLLATVYAFAAMPPGRLEIAVFLAFYVFTVLGIEMGYHRLFAHRSYRLHPALRFALAVFGSMAAQGSVTYWVANHRRHHAFSDRPEDPHSPYFVGGRPASRWRGLWHAHMGWVFDHDVTNPLRFARDHLTDRLVVFVGRYYLAWVALGLLLPGAIGFALTGSVGSAAACAMWGGLVRMVVVQHGTFAINSVCHAFGTRPFEIRDQSRNNWLLAIPSLGGAWHHNHHAFPSSAVLSLRWWQVDPCGLLIRICQRLGLAHDVLIADEARIRRRNARTTEDGNDQP